jgi:nicotinamide phosphoribosyltransferase
MDNIILRTDSYKLNHWNQYPKGTEKVYSYFEARKGAKYPYTVFFGLQSIIKRNLIGRVVTQNKIEQAARLCLAHFGSDKLFNRAGWEHILHAHNGQLPVRIKAVPEGSVVPINNVLMTVENTDRESFWLTNALESLLTHVWYPTTVATQSHSVKHMIEQFLVRTADNTDGLPFMLHDFGYRGVSSDESAEIGGAAHLLNFMGTDTVSAMVRIDEDYGGLKGPISNYEGIAYSVPATEHSIMTSLGKDGEPMIVKRLLEEYPTGILSCVADSYDIYYFVSHIVGKFYKDKILARDGVFVVRPDSVSDLHNTPESMMLWIMESLWNSIGGTVNAKGFKVINPKVKVLWGDGIDPDGIRKILETLEQSKYSAANIATFGMGGGLLQKINRDTQRFAFKSSWQQRSGQGFNVFKQPVDVSKASKRGRLKLVNHLGAHGSAYVTVPEAAEGKDILETVFENGELVKDYTFTQARENARAVCLQGEVWK